jgi:flagellar hook-associated protein 2
MISSAYTYYLTQYGNKANTKYDTHSRTQLKNSFGKVVKSNSQSPIYKIDLSENAQKYAIDLKEHARQLGFVARDLSDDASGEMIYKKSAVSSNPEAVSAEYIGDSSTPDAGDFEVAVKQVATSQTNTGHFLQPGSKHLTPGDYSFDLNINNLTYEFEFGVSEDETSLDIQNKISRLINRSKIGLTSTVETDSIGNTALKVTSNATGVPGIKPTIFNIEGSDGKEDNITLVDTFGLDRVTEYPSNAIYSVNGNVQNSQSNDITINNTYALTLNSVTGDEPAVISMNTDDSSMVDTINELLSGYNEMISVFGQNTSLGFEGNERLKREFTRIADAHSVTLNNNGLSIKDDGSISVDKDAVISASNDGKLDSIFEELNQFKKSIQRKADDLATNPMDYVNNKIIAYKNPRRTMNDPYNLSAYTGMMFNDFV